MSLKRGAEEGQERWLQGDGKRERTKEDVLVEEGERAVWDIVILVRLWNRDG